MRKLNKKIIGKKFYELLNYAIDIDLVIKNNDMELLDRKVETKLTDYITVLSFQKNFMALSAALFFMMISWIFIIFTILKILHIKNAPAIHFGVYMILIMLYMLTYISSVFLIARGITLSLKIIYLTFLFIVVMASVFSLYYLHKFFCQKFSA